MLTRLGIEVRTAENGTQDIECVRERIPDIIFLGIRMSDVNASEVLVRLIKEHGKENLKVVAVTASVFDHQRRQFLEQGFDDFVAKPFRVEVVLEMVAKLRGVTFECEDRAEAGSDPINLGRIALPYEIRRGSSERDRHSSSDRRVGEIGRSGTRTRRLPANLERVV
jgi:CheY-like chemotaxis protein